jgi:hypothetical protein
VSREPNRPPALPSLEVIEEYHRLRRLVTGARARGEDDGPALAELMEFVARHGLGDQCPAGPDGEPT